MGEKKRLSWEWMWCDGKEGLGLDFVDCYYSEMVCGLCDCGVGVGGVMEGMMMV